MEPDSEDLEIDSVTGDDGEDYTLSSEDEERALELLWDALRDAAGEAAGESDYFADNERDGWED